MYSATCLQLLHHPKVDQLSALTKLSLRTSVDLEHLKNSCNAPGHLRLVELRDGNHLDGLRVWQGSLEVFESRWAMGDEDLHKKR